MSVMQPHIFINRFPLTPSQRNTVPLKFKAYLTSNMEAFRGIYVHHVKKNIPHTHLGAQDVNSRANGGVAMRLRSCAVPET